MSLYKPKGRSNYSYSFEIQGDRFSGSTGTGDRREAKKIVDQLKREKKEEIAKQASFTANGPMSFQVAASRYWIEVGQFIVNSVVCFRDLGWLEKEIGKNTLLQTIGDSKVAEMVAKRRGDGVSNATVNRSVTEPLRAVIRRAALVWKVPVGGHRLE